MTEPAQWTREAAEGDIDPKTGVDKWLAKFCETRTLLKLEERRTEALTADVERLTRECQGLRLKLIEADRILRQVSAVAGEGSGLLSNIPSETKA